MNNLLARLKSIDLPEEELTPAVAGHLVRVVGLTLEARGLQVALGDRCAIETQQGPMYAEVVGFAGDLIYLMPTEQLSGVMPGARVTPCADLNAFPYGDHLLGRVIDGMGEPLDGLGTLTAPQAVKWTARRINPMARKPIRQPLDVGVRAINGLLTIGQGQRMGLFAGSGVGKSVLLGMMTRGTAADIVVVGLIGERGREVKEFIDDILGPEGRARSVVVAAPADASPLMRLKGCETTMQIAEYFRDQGRNVLLLMDSLTRYAMAQRENLQDPIADSARAILDGHIVLSRQLADSGHYPAIDVEKSISRVMPAVVSPEQLVMARTIRQCLASYNQNQELIAIGAYQQGSDPRIDQALMIKPHIDEYTQQGMQEVISYQQSLEGLKQLSLMLIQDAQQKVAALQQGGGHPAAQSGQGAQGQNNARPAVKMSFKKKG